MDLTEHVESDVARIESKIRHQRFEKDFPERWMKWAALLGLILGTGAAVCFLWASFAGPLESPDAFVITIWAVALVGGSVLLGCFLPALVFGLIICFRPVYVALFCDIAQFEREYGSTPEPLGRLPRRVGS
jgi:hypothetical protein